jgi:Mn-containing catalase
MGNGSAKKDHVIAMAMDNPKFLLESGGGPLVTDSVGVPWTGVFVNSNGDLTVDLRSNIGAETQRHALSKFQTTSAPSQSAISRLANATSNSIAVKPERLIS